MELVHFAIHSVNSGRLPAFTFLLPVLTVYAGFLQAKISSGAPRQPDTVTFRFLFSFTLYHRVYQDARHYIIHVGPVACRQRFHS